MSAFAMAHPYLSTWCFAMACFTVFACVSAAADATKSAFESWRRR